jgi:hypothetical protein
MTMTQGWKSQLSDVSGQLDLELVRATRQGVARLRHTGASALNYVRQNEPELMFDDQPVAPAVRQWLPKVRPLLMREKDNRVLIVGCQMKNIDPKGTGFIDGKHTLLFENDDSTRRLTKSLPDGVGVLFQARFQSHGRMLPLINEAKGRVDPITNEPNPVLIVPVLRPTEIRQLITLGRMPEDELLARLRPRLPSHVQAAMREAGAEVRAASTAVLDGAMRKYARGHGATTVPRETEEPPSNGKGRAKSGAIKEFLERHPALDGEGAAAQARRLTPLALTHFGRDASHYEKTFKTLETTISSQRKRDAQAAPVTPSVPTPAPPMPPPPPPREEPPPQMPPPRPVNDTPPPGGGLDKTMSAIDALADSLREIELHAERMANHGKVLAEHAGMLMEQIGFAKFAIENARGDLKSGLQADIEQRVRAALVHVMGGA